MAFYGKGASGLGQAMHHGHGAKVDEVDIDRGRFFRAVDRGMLEHHSRPSGLPLLLAALPEYHTPFRAISHNPFLLNSGIKKNPASLLLEADREIPGRIDSTTGEIALCDLAHPEIDDLLDDLAETVLRRQGEVVVVPAERMPAATGVAAIYRYR